MGNKSLETKAKEVLKDKQEEIIKFFNEHAFNLDDKSNNNNAIYNNDLPLIKKYFPSQNKYNIYLEIFNMPALFKENKGFIFTINKIAIYCFTFKAKYEQENLTKEEFNNRFKEFLNAILEVNDQKINDLLNENIIKDDLIKLKQGLEKLYQYFGPDTVENYYKEIIGTGVLAGTVAGTFYGFISGFSLCSIGISAGVGCLSGLALGIFVGYMGYFIYETIQKYKMEKNIINNRKCIQTFFDKIQDFKVDKLIGHNLLVLALNIKNENINEITIFPHNLDKINSLICPIIGPNAEPSSNSLLYYTYLDATEFYILKYSDKINHESYYEIVEHLKEDFKNLEKLNSLTVEEIRYFIEKERRNTFKTNNYENAISTNSTNGYTLQNYTNNYINTNSTNNNINSNSPKTQLFNSYRGKKSYENCLQEVCN